MHAIAIAHGGGSMLRLLSELYGKVHSFLTILLNTGMVHRTVVIEYK